MMSQSDLHFSEYTDRLKRLGVVPNFFISERYWQAAGWRAFVQMNGEIHVLDGDGHEMLPPVGPDRLLPAEVWCGLEGYGGLGRRVFLDHQFIYDPASFHDLSGHGRAVFRKNVRRFEKWHPEWAVRPPTGSDELVGALGEWLEPGQEVYDLETIMAYLEACPAEEARVLETEEGVVAINAWDSNWAFINFRYNFVRRGVKYASEFARLRFYLEMAERRPGVLVNDGGSLGSEALFRFKEKLGPVRVDSLYSWKKEPE